MLVSSASFELMNVGDFYGLDLYCNGLSAGNLNFYIPEDIDLKF